MAKRKDRKVKLATLIAVGEGAHDKAFLNHMKGIYDYRHSGQKVTVDSADGGSPEDIIQSVIRKNRHAAYDRSYILLDSDIPIPEKARNIAKQKRIELIESTPLCLEGMLLEILEEPVPEISQKCKDFLHPKLACAPTDPKAYKNLFSKDVLDNTDKEQIKILRKILQNNYN